MHAVTSWIFSWADLVNAARRAYRRALAHRLAEARLEERRLQDRLPHN